MEKIKNIQKNITKSKMKQIRNDYFYIFIKIKPLTTFSHKVEKNCFNCRVGHSLKMWKNGISFLVKK